MQDSVGTKYSGAQASWGGSLQSDPTAQHNSMFNLNIPQQVSNIGWNWDYDANTTRNPQFKYLFPGGVGWMRLYQPYLKAHFRLNMTFKSHIDGIMTAPHVNVTAALKGYADFNADVATAVNFQTDQSASVLDNILAELPFLGLQNLTKDEMFMNPVTFYFGGTPFTVKPGFSCQLKAYHIGLLKGSLRVGLSTKLLLLGVMNFDTDLGIMNNLSAKAVDVQFTPPTWMLFTNHFEMGMMLQPTMWLSGSFGSMKDMEMGFALRPFFNISIVQKNALNGVATNELAVYPWRVVGLPAGKNYVVKIGANGQYKMTSNQMSTGVCEYADNIEDFTFGMVDQTSLIGAPIEVSILENGQDPPVATTTATCTAVVNGECSPGIVIASMQVEGKTVEVHMSVVWEENALSVLENKIKSISLQFPSITISSTALTTAFAAKGAVDNAQLVFSRNGRSYAVPLMPKMKTTQFLESAVVIELGPLFLDAWKPMTQFKPMTDGVTNTDKTMPMVELMLNNVVVASGMMPPVQWEQSGATANIDIMSNSLKTKITPVPTMVPLYADGVMAGTAEIEIDVMPADISAFWIFPYEAQDFTGGVAYSFTWTTHGAVAGVAYNFTLTAQVVSEDGSLTPTSWQQPVSAACQTNLGITVYRYHGSTDPCGFQVKITIPEKLVGKRVVMTALWLDANMMPHEMVSEPVSFVATGGAPPSIGGTPSAGTCGAHEGAERRGREWLGHREQRNGRQLDLQPGGQGEAREAAGALQCPGLELCHRCGHELHRADEECDAPGHGHDARCRIDLGLRRL